MAKRNATCVNCGAPATVTLKRVGDLCQSCNDRRPQRVGDLLLIEALDAAEDTP